MSREADEDLAADIFRRMDHLLPLHLNRRSLLLLNMQLPRLHRRNRRGGRHNPRRRPPQGEPADLPISLDIPRLRTCTPMEDGSGTNPGAMIRTSIWITLGNMDASPVASAAVTSFGSPV